MRAAAGCGVAEFIDWEATEGEASIVIKQQLQARAQAPAATALALEPETQGFALPLLGARGHGRYYAGHTSCGDVAGNAGP